MVLIKSLNPTLQSIMSVSVDVHLLSGKSASLEVEADEFVESLKQRAQSTLATEREAAEFIWRGA